MMTRRTAKPEATGAPDDARDGPYGYVLVLRAIASHAMRFPEYPASLRVLVVLAMSMDQRGECYVGQFSIADRLGITRQAVNKQLALLVRCGTIVAIESPGKTSRYAIDFEGLTDDKPGQADVDERREARRAAKRKACPREAPLSAERVKPAPTTNTDQNAPEGQPKEDTHVADLRVDATVSHIKFGPGRVVEIDGDKITVDFAGTARKVVRSFLQMGA